MSAEEIFRVNNVGSQITVAIKEPDPNSPGTTIPIDLTNADFVGFEFRRPNKTTFRINNKAGDPDLVTPPSTIVILSAVNGQIRFKDNIGIWNTVGRWAYRGFYAEIVASVTEIFNGSWTERRVGL